MTGVKLVVWNSSTLQNRSETSNSHTQPGYTNNTAGNIGRFLPHQNLHQLDFVSFKSAQRTNMIMVLCCLRIDCIGIIWLQEISLHDSLPKAIFMWNKLQLHITYVTDLLQCPSNEINCLFHWFISLAVNLNNSFLSAHENRSRNFS